MSEESRERIPERLRKVAGQPAGIQRMIATDRNSVDVLHRISAVEGAVDRIGHLILNAHVERCITSALESGKPRERKERLAELIDVFSRFGRVQP